MSTASWAQFIVFVALVFAGAPLLGWYMAKVYGDEKKAPGDRVFGAVERLIYRICGVDENQEQRWTAYAFSVIGFSIFSLLFLYGLMRLQGVLPLNPNDFDGPVHHLSWNTAVSFTTNTNWQSYAGEVTMSNLTQMAGLAVQNFVSAAAGMAVMVALIRGLARRRASTLGNFWVDLTRTMTRILLPLSFVFALFLVSQGVIQNFNGNETITTVEGTEQVIPGGPAASQIAIKQIGTNGGGFFNMNSAHPFENSGPLNNFGEMYAICIIPFALAFTYGRMVGDKRQGRAVFGIMLVIWAGMSLAAMGLEGNGNPLLDDRGTNQEVTSTQAGGNMEGKEVRFGPAASGLWAASTTGTSNGSVNSMHDSFTPLGGMIPLSHMMLGEVSPGGVGVGLNGMLIMVILSVFIAGLMVGRTPEYLGKKIQASEMKLVVLYILAMPLVLSGFRSRLDVRRLGEERDDLEPRTTRALGDPLRVHVGSEQQRFRLRRHHRGDAMDGHDTRYRDARRPLPADHPDPRDRRIHGPQAADAGNRRHVPDAHAVVRWARDRSDAGRRRTHILPGPRARPHRRAAVPVGAVDEHRHPPGRQQRT